MERKPTNSRVKPTYWIISLLLIFPLTKRKLNQKETSFQFTGWIVEFIAVNSRCSDWSRIRQLEMVMSVVNWRRWWGRSSTVELRRWTLVPSRSSWSNSDFGSYVVWTFVQRTVRWGGRLWASPLRPSYGCSRLLGPLCTWSSQNDEMNVNEGNKVQTCLPGCGVFLMS